MRSTPVSIASARTPRVAPVAAGAAARCLGGRAWLVGLGLAGACGGAAETETESSSAASGPTGAPWFVERAREAGLDFVHVRGPERFWFPEIMGGGVGLLDADGDGDLDVYLVQSGDLDDPAAGPRNALFVNRGDGTFDDVSAGSGADDAGYGMGCACGDYDGDGDVDVYVTNVGRNTLLRNDGTGRFVDVTDAAGVGDPGWGTSAAFLDYDGDADLDLFVVNYVHWASGREVECSGGVGRDYCSPNTYDSPARDVLYENLGDGTFVDATERAGFASGFGNGLGVAVADLDGDQRPDVYVANDMMPNQLWRNRGDGTFFDDALFAGCAANMNGESEAGMGVVAFDVEDDGDLDLFMTHLREETNTLYVNDRGLFADRTVALGLSGPSLRFTGFGVVAADFDHDGRSDLLVANGAVTRNRPELVPGDAYAEPNQVFRGLEKGFEEVALVRERPGARAFASRGAAVGDLDGDGDLDAVIVESGGPVSLLDNVAASGNWVRIRASVAGALVGVRTAGGRTMWRSASPVASYCASSDPCAHFGLGSDGGDVEVVVRWPWGGEELFGPFAPNATHGVERGRGRAR